VDEVPRGGRRTGAVAERLIISEDCEIVLGVDHGAERGPDGSGAPAGDRAGGTADLDEAVRALANQARRTILVLTWREQRLAGQIAEALDLAPATVSEHLKVLRKTGLVRLERRGTQWRYRADPDRLRAVLDALDADLSPRSP
jgi:DNA-binding transcriptional ArsR family regulator